MLRRAWSCFTHKQWLIAYPFALSVVGTLAFLAVYATDGQPLTITGFFTADFDRMSYIREHFIDSFSLSSPLLVAVLAGLAFCLFSALILAPFYRAVAGYRYPLAPRSWTEAGRLFLFYLVFYAVTWLAPVAGPLEGFSATLIFTVVQVFAIVVVFSDFAIVFEDIGAVAGLRRSVRLVGLRLGPVLLIYVVLFLALTGVRALYTLYFDGAARVFVLLPISHMLVESLILLLGTLALIFLYEDLRRRSPA